MYVLHRNSNVSNEFWERRIFLNIYFKISNFCSLTSKTLKTLKKQQKNELLTLQIVSFKSISIAKFFVSRALFHAFSSTILFVKT